MMPVRFALLASCLLVSCSADSMRREALPETGEHAVQYQFLHDGKAKDFGGILDAPYADFRNDAHGLEIHVSRTRNQIDPRHNGPEGDVVNLDINFGGRDLNWRIEDRNHKIDRYRLASIATRNSGSIALILQRQANDETILTSVMVLHLQMDDQESKLPSYKGEMWDRVGQDVDGDGTMELLVPDQRFTDAFGSAGKVPVPPLIYALQHGRYVDASRDGAYFAYYEALRASSWQACEVSDTLLRSSIRAACFAAVSGLAARSGHWPAARQRLKVVNADFANLALPARARDTARNEKVGKILGEWGYVPADPSARWWTASWFDYYGVEHSGGFPFEVQMLIHDLQGCNHFGDEPTEQPDGSVNERVVMMQENYCLRPDGEGEFIGVGDLQWDWINRKYRTDDQVRQILEDY